MHLFYFNNILDRIFSKSCQKPKLHNITQQIYINPLGNIFHIMGNVMGGIPQSGFNLYFHPELTPDPRQDPTFDPNLGFPKGRKERVMIATEEEMRSAKLPLRDRDYCAHLLLKFRSCRRENWPWVVNCEHEKHTFLNCKYDDFIIRMKEYERERRLKVKAHKEADAA